MFHMWEADAEVEQRRWPVFIQLTTAGAMHALDVVVALSLLPLTQTKCMVVGQLVMRQSLLAWLKPAVSD
jgi:hypothetical protein